MVVTEILPSDTYRISQLEPSNCRLYATTAQVSQLKAWRSWNEDDDSSENFDEEPGMQRPKRTNKSYECPSKNVNMGKCFGYPSIITLTHHIFPRVFDLLQQKA
ncbi:hypothetical protein AVEN_52369-1 [Araneus ventricosus]|uniref:Uncharacterized protein n=1 Tax=Araneus ventricosus TaxID=182803 RepID=A0A4Y2W9Q1_ARAVE|nr:hypothetical protein AVEN_52369-1 [Araneus ventricosus]